MAIPVGSSVSKSSGLALPCWEKEWDRLLSAFSTLCARACLCGPLHATNSYLLEHVCLSAVCACVCVYEFVRIFVCVYIYNYIYISIDDTCGFIYVRVCLCMHASLCMRRTQLISTAFGPRRAWLISFAASTNRSKETYLENTVDSSFSPLLYLSGARTRSSSGQRTVPSNPGGEIAGCVKLKSRSNSIRHRAPQSGLLRMKSGLQELNLSASDMHDAAGICR